MLQDNFISAPSKKVGLSEFDIDQARDVYFEELEALVERNSDEIAFKGGSALVQALLDRKAQIAVASSAPLAKVKMSLKAAGINIDDFGAVCCEDTFQGPLKPEPDVFVKAADDLGVKPANAVVIEDADVGVQAARKGGQPAHLRVECIDSHCHRHDHAHDHHIRPPHTGVTYYLRDCVHCVVRVRVLLRDTTAGLWQA